MVLPEVQQSLQQFHQQRHQGLGLAPPLQGGGGESRPQYSSLPGLLSLAQHSAPSSPARAVLQSSAMADGGTHNRSRSVTTLNMPPVHMLMHPTAGNSLARQDRSRSYASLCTLPGSAQQQVRQHCHSLFLIH